MELKRQIKRYASEILFPQNNCIVCKSSNAGSATIIAGQEPVGGQVIRRINGLTTICPTCKKEFELSLQGYCIRCHKPLDIRSSESVLCTDCENNTNKYLSYNRSAILYNSFAKELVSLYKYKGRESLLPLLNNLLALTYDEYFKNESIDLITYVPIHSNRLEVRGFNQAEMLARGVHKYTSKPLFETLLRIKDTKKQSKQHKWDRLSEVQGSFALGIGISKELVNKNILIIDDIYTTGFTLNECAYILKQAGAQNIYGLTLARAFSIKNDK